MNKVLGALRQKYHYWYALIFRENVLPPVQVEQVHYPMSWPFKRIQKDHARARTVTLLASI